jgi:beta-1,4-N-acetylglucosaminyltransferase
MASSSSLVFKTIFVTVGTTDFDMLITAIDTPEFVSFIKSRGCRKLIVQIGRGRKEPQYITNLSEAITVEVYRYKPSLAADMTSADLILSHAGAGSISEALQLRKTLIVCVNEALMGNHQVELAEALAERNYCFFTVPSRLCDFLDSSDYSALRVYPTPDPEVFAHFLTDALGLNSHDD